MYNLDYFSNNNIDDYIRLDLEKNPTIKQWEEVIKASPQKTAILLIDFKQDAFDYFVNNLASQFKVINLWKCPLIEDISKLATLTQLEYLLINWNQKATQLWDLSCNKHLKGVLLHDVNKINSFEMLTLSPSLSELAFGNGVFSTSNRIVPSLWPLTKVTNLKFVELSITHIIDNDVTPLTKIKNLQSLYFPKKLFSFEQVAYLTAHLPTIKSNCLQPIITLKQAIGEKDCLVVGKRMPFLNSQKDDKRLQKYIDSFNNLVKNYQQNSQLVP